LLTAEGGNTVEVNIVQQHWFLTKEYEEITLDVTVALLLPSAGEQVGGRKQFTNGQIDH